jgi:hypothetical protein
MIRLLRTLVWLALLAGGTSALLLTAVPPGQQGRRDGKALGPGLWFQVPRLWPVTLHPLEPPVVSPGSTLPAADAIAAQVGRLQAQSAAMHAAIEADRRRAAEAAAAEQATQAREDAATERTRAGLLAEAGQEAAQIVAEAETEAARILGETESHHARALAEAELALAQVEAERDRLFASALSGPGGRYYAAIEAARRFELGHFDLDTRDPEFLKKFGSMAAWRRFFLDE